MPEGRIGGWTPEQVTERAKDLVPQVVKALVRKPRSGEGISTVSRRVRLSASIAARAPRVALRLDG